ncbi:MAG: chromosome segregation protein SMC [Planctomycetota bacterium]
MLKALELVGFKSFADKTRFDFPAGITVVVGPNGSGKSNVVDAIKWVLGEQSAKSLRGQDMADVIFKGSGTSGRKPLNTAEATIIFDNIDRRLPLDAPEVHVTRRVYRSGEGEYLINRQPCRLKDIKDLFRGTGVGVDAYSLIEQGKVDRLLQASPKDRRAMFEEAAGISRFKSKKLEAQRRIERVDQNLLRLNDIVEEVENRLRGVRAQASKAKRYREHQQRLQDLRTQVGLADWRALTDQINARERECQQLRDSAAEIHAKAELIEAQSLEIDTELTVSVEQVRQREMYVAQCREQIVAHESTAHQDRARIQDLSDEAQRHRRHIAALCSRAGDLRGRRREFDAKLLDYEREHGAVAGRLAIQESLLQDATAQLTAARTELDAQRTRQMAKLRGAATLSNEASGYRSQLAALAETAQRCRLRVEQLDLQHARDTAELTRLQAAEVELEQKAEEQAKTLTAIQHDLAENRRIHARRQQELAEMNGMLGGVRERADMLVDWETRREGLGTGVKEVLELTRQPHPGALAEVRGLVADFVQANLEVAPLIDIALGEAAQHLIVSGDELLRQLANATFRPSARVGFVRLSNSGWSDQANSTSPTVSAVHSQPIGRTAASTDLELLPGVLGRADRLVETTPEYASLICRLLGDTWIVVDLDTAFALQSKAARGSRFVARTGQLLDRDGTVISCARQTSAGLVSRRSELRDLRRRIEVLESRILESEREIERLQVNIEQQVGQVRMLTADHQQLMATLTEHRMQTRTLADQCLQASRQREAVASEWDDVQRQHAAVSAQLDEASSQLTAIEEQLQELEAAIKEAESGVQRLDSARQQATAYVTAARVELAKSEQRVDTLRIQLRQFERDEEERRQAIANARHLLEQSVERATACERRVLMATSQLAEWYLNKESVGVEILSAWRRRDELTLVRSQLTEKMQGHRRQIRSLEERLREQELAVGTLQHERQALVSRLQDDYGIDIASVELPVTGEEQQAREQVEEEIAGLRKRLQSIGSVNMEALEELDELEARFASLSGQFNDLKQAKESLERIIQRINMDSRRLFLETLEKIRTNFQTLYRRAFGGGRADIVLEEGVDPLEGGVDIMATPPGKPSFNNSLLSGGEKALTAVALLLAIFQFRPSPFCVLDEVDAPFDEANIGRFMDVLKDFLGFTKFVIVTHSKKTMTSATTLYGITMQESGVSKRVAVKFEDVTEDGHIRREAVEQAKDERSISGGEPTAEERTGGQSAA